ncbi:MEDS domain-containing protein [Mucilaginibacter sp. BT774]|uniref:MEDS domain-containing protein n=1 Tax=Mucilaginibacter sp. BT774 TaxID=3062276 RepID=UPI0026751F5C|nr:MEDS domain-containing protein [Mucilaginibacter sp. BT774]MDO3628712.1 MEDS domain-containing protein [Mucilaginibacter sp. BT774]
MIYPTDTYWKKSRADIFWAEIAPCDHVVQIYENQDVFLDSLSGFVGGGINAGECVIVIATAVHLHALKDKLESFGIKVDSLIDDDRFIAVDAEETLAKFMVDGWPNEELFIKTVSKLIDKAGLKQRRVRAFGEMVAVLWAQGNAGATVNLEYLWNRFCEKQSFCLFCAYPKSGFTHDINQSIDDICGCHSKMIDGNQQSLTHVLYKNTN